MNDSLHYFIISDAVGDTALKLAKSVFAQFPSVKTVLHKFSHISNKERLHEIILAARQHNAIIFMTIVNQDLADYGENLARELDLSLFNLIQPIVKVIEDRTLIAPAAIAGVQHELSEKYFDRVKAIEFCIHYDDGKDLSGIHEADIVLLGISRTGKTPLSMYLGTLGYKVLNIPILLENDPPSILFEIDPHKIIGLTNEVSVINRHREKRMHEYGMPPGTRYASKERISEELVYAKDLYQKLGCFVLNVADRSIEESASIILETLDLPMF